MQIVGWGHVDKFVKKHPEAKPAFGGWRMKLDQADWKNPAEVTERFGKQADLVDGIWVFNVAGNKYRVTATIKFEAKSMLIEEVMTHPEYDKGKWKK